MIKQRHPIKTARITLLLVGWVCAICFMQNSAFFNVCAFKTAALSEQTKVMVASADVSEKAELGEQCDLTEKLLSSAKLNLEHLMVFSFILLLAIVAWLAQTRSQFASFTEPIVPKTRIHLTLCVFRE